MGVGGTRQKPRSHSGGIDTSTEPPKRKRPGSSIAHPPGSEHGPQPLQVRSPDSTASTTWAPRVFPAAPRPPPPQLAGEARQNLAAPPITPALDLRKAFSNPDPGSGSRGGGAVGSGRPAAPCRRGPPGRPPASGPSWAPSETGRAARRGRGRGGSEVVLAGFHVSGCRRALPAVTGALGGDGPACAARADEWAPAQALAGRHGPQGLCRCRQNRWRQRLVCQGRPSHPVIRSCRGQGPYEPSVTHSPVSDTQAPRAGRARGPLTTGPLRPRPRPPPGRPRRDPPRPNRAPRARAAGAHTDTSGRDTGWPIAAARGPWCPSRS